MAEKPTENTTEEKNTTEFNISETLKKYDVYYKKESNDKEYKSGIDNSDWVIPSRGKVNEATEKIDMDYYWNMKGVMSPRIEVEFFIKNKEKKGEWININSKSITNSITKATKNIVANNNYFVSANITDNGIKRLNLVLYDRNFTDIQRLLGNAIQFANDRMSNNTNNSTNEYDMDIDSKNKNDGIIMFYSPNAKITNLRIRYGYNENIDETVNRKYSGVGAWASDETSKSRWRSLTDESESISYGNYLKEEDSKSTSYKNYLEKNSDKFLSTEETLIRTDQQSTILSSYEEFFITGLSTTLTNTGIKYSIQAVSIDDLALNGYKMYQQYSKITGKPKTIIASLMKKFNEEDKNDKSPIKLVWADEEVRATDASINGSEVLYDYQNGNYETVDENKVKEVRKEGDEPIRNINEYVDMLNNIKSCFTNKVDCTISSYVEDLEIQRNSLINDISNKISSSNTLDSEVKENKKVFSDTSLYVYDDSNSENIINDIKKMAKYQKSAALIYNIYGKKIKVEDREKRTYSQFILSWLSMIAIKAFNLDNISISESIKSKVDKYNDFEKAKNELDDGVKKMSEYINKVNSTLPLQWYIEIPWELDDISYHVLLSDEAPEKIYYLKAVDYRYCYIGSIQMIPTYGEEFNNRHMFEAFRNFKINTIKEFYDYEDFETELLNVRDVFTMYHISNMKLFRHDKIKGIFKTKSISIKDIIDFGKTCLEDIVDYMEIDYTLPEVNDITNGNNNINISSLRSLKNTVKDALRLQSMGEYEDKIKIIDLKEDFYDINNLEKNIQLVTKVEKVDRYGPYDCFNDIIVYDEDFQYMGSVEKKEDLSLEGQVTGHAYEVLEKGKIYEFKDGEWVPLENGKKIGNFSFKFRHKFEGFETRQKEDFISFIRNVISINDFAINKKSICNIYSKKSKESTIVSTNEDVNFLKKYNFLDSYTSEPECDFETLTSAKENYKKYLDHIKDSINNKYDSYNIDELSKKYNSTKNNYEDDKIDKENYKFLLSSVIKDISDDNSTKDLDYVKFKIDKEGSTEKFGEIDSFNKYNNTENLLKVSFNIVKDYGSEPTKFPEKLNELMEDLNTKIKYLNEKKDILLKEQERIDKSNIGKEIELSLGTQESKNQDLRLTKTLASLLNDLCSQCAPKISRKEGKYKGEGDSKVYDEAGNSKIINVYDNIPRYNLTWGVVGYYKGTTPIVGLYYKQPNKIKNIRKYRWGTGNNKPHCIKALNISASSEYALMNINTLTKDGSGNNVTLKDKDLVMTVDNVAVPKTCYFSQVFESTRDENIFNNYSNTLNKGTLTLLGDPSLKFYGSVQPFTYPIFLDIKLTRERVKDWSEKKEETIDEDTLAPVSQLSGFYMISSITHDISSSGYTTTLEIIKYPGSDELYFRT